MHRLVLPLDRTHAARVPPRSPVPAGRQAVGAEPGLVGVVQRSSQPARGSVDAGLLSRGAGRPAGSGADPSRRDFLVERIPGRGSQLLVQRGGRLLHPDPDPAATAGADGRQAGAGEVAARSEPQPGATRRPSRPAQPTFPVQQPPEHLRHGGTGSADHKPHVDAAGRPAARRPPAGFPAGNARCGKRST